ncbi:uncharacterized protein [Lolium perenne]|uniref:uncharacterized protein isoform X1 n=1 Tax=Lolium perenne TaxID=4522 RepID=UPI0021F64189|nr:uncharacterized protein LOC127315015 isoform X2 [Lolium perenne]
MQQPRRPSFRLPSSTAAVTFQLVFVRAIAGRRLVAAPSTSGHAAISASSLEARPRAVPCSGTCCSVRPRHVMAVIDHLLPPVSIKAAPKSASAVVALRQKLAPFPGHDVVQSRPHPCSNWALLVFGSSWLFGDRNRAPAPPRQLPSQRPLVPPSADVASSPSAFASSRIGSRSVDVRYDEFSDKFFCCFSQASPPLHLFYFYMLF